MAPTIVYTIPDRISDGYLIQDRVYYGRLFISSKNKLVQHDSMFLTILSMSDCHGVCFLIIDRGVSVGTNAWEVCEYSISEVEWYYQAVSQNQGVL